VARRSFDLQLKCSYEAEHPRALANVDEHHLYGRNFLPILFGGLIASLCFISLAYYTCGSGCKLTSQPPPENASEK
jgi:hypothetical protein